MRPRAIEIAIGRLLTDEDFRETFLTSADAALEQLFAQGVELSPGEINALVGIDPRLWRRAAEQTDPRLQKASLKTEADGVSDES